MKAMVLNEYGENAEFTAHEQAAPSVTSGHVRVRVAASSVNTVDMMIRAMGQEQLPFAPSLPAVLGMDFAGTIDAVGEGVEGFQVGDEVYGCAGGLMDLQGSLAEYMLADARLIAHKPKSIGMREAAALPLVGITAYEGMKRAGLSAGQNVLVHGGAGGVGHVAIQLAKAAGANVFSTGSSAAKLEAITQLGAVAIDYKAQTVEDYVNQHTQGTGFDLVFDSVGGENMANSFAAAALNAQVATTVSLLEMDLSAAHFKGLSLHVVFMLIPMLHNHGRSEHGQILSELADLVDQGKLKPLLDADEFGLADVNAAYAKLASGNAIGKVVVSN